MVSVGNSFGFQPDAYVGSLAKVLSKTCSPTHDKRFADVVISWDIFSANLLGQNRKIDTNVKKSFPFAQKIGQPR